MIALASDYTSSIQIVGLGGTGANVIESFVQNHENLLPLLKTPENIVEFPELRFEEKINCLR